MDSVNAISAAKGGLTAARLRMEMAAALLARVTLVAPPDASGDASAGGAAGSEPDVAMALVEQLLALRTFGLNASVARTADDLAAETMGLADGLAAR